MASAWRVESPTVPSRSPRGNPARSMSQAAASLTRPSGWCHRGMAGSPVRTLTWAATSGGHDGIREEGAARAPVLVLRLEDHQLRPPDGQHRGADVAERGPADPPGLEVALELGIPHRGDAEPAFEQGFGHGSVRALGTASGCSDRSGPLRRPSLGEAVADEPRRGQDRPAPRSLREHVVEQRAARPVQSRRRARASLGWPRQRHAASVSVALMSSASSSRARAGTFPW
jgi:hypothetical protein